MNIIYKEDNEGINFVDVHDILVKAFDGRAFLDAEDIKKSFLNSQYVIYALDDTKLIGVGRAIADSEWSIIYNIALLPEYHKLGIGKTLINKLVSQLKGHHIFVYTHPKTVSMYETLGFNRSKQAFRYVGLDSEEEVNRREEVGFYLPYGYKFEEEFYKEKRNAANRWLPTQWSFLKKCLESEAFWVSLIYLFLFKIISAAITPGTQPQSVSRNTMSIEPQPRSYTAKGGKRMERRTRRKDMVVLFLIMNYIFHQCSHGNAFWFGTQMALF